MLFGSHTALFSFEITLLELIPDGSCSKERPRPVPGCCSPRRGLTPGFPSQEGFDALDPFVPVPVPNYSPREFESCYGYYLDRKWLQHEKGQRPARERAAGASARGPACLRRGGGRVPAEEAAAPTHLLSCSAHGGRQGGAAVPERLEPAAAGAAGGTPLAQ